VKIDPSLKDTFLELCRREGLSICHILEGLIAGFIYGYQKDKSIPSITIEQLVVQREVKRVRRRKVEVLGVGFEDVGGGEAYCPLDNIFLKKIELPLVKCWGCPNERCLGKLRLSVVEGGEG